MTLPRFYPIIDDSLCRAREIDPLALGAACIQGGARWLQLRVKSSSDGAFLELAERLLVAARGSGAMLIVNDRADLAALGGADGVHVGQDDLPPRAVRHIAPNLIVGLSTHSEDQIAAAAVEPVDYLAVGPVFGTTTKDTGYGAVGLPMVARASRAARRRPVVAIGGITLGTAASVIHAGASAVAVISDLLVGRPEDRVRQYLRALA